MQQLTMLQCGRKKGSNYAAEYASCTAVSDSESLYRLIWPESGCGRDYWLWSYLLCILSYNFLSAFFWQSLDFCNCQSIRFWPRFYKTPTLMRIPVLAFVLNQLNVLKQNKSRLLKFLPQESIKLVYEGGAVWCDRKNIHKEGMTHKRLRRNVVRPVALVPRLYKTIKNLLFTRCTWMHDEGRISAPVSKSVTPVNRVAITDSKTGRWLWWWCLLHHCSV